jgi:uncharacterized protein (DUF983 family)
VPRGSELIAIIAGQSRAYFLIELALTGRSPYVCPANPIPNACTDAGTMSDLEKTERSDISNARQAMARGARGRCPHCGEGGLFRAFLKVSDRCTNCGEELHHHRADDFPAYLVIVIVGHIVVPLVLAVETQCAPPYWFSMTLWPSLTAVLSLALLQPVKGAVVGLQWAMGMHGFEASKKLRDATAQQPSYT